MPALALLQYSWLGRLSEAEQERMHRTLVTATQQLAYELETELGRAVTGLHMDATTLERGAWDVLAQRYDAWSASAIAPRFVKGIYLALLPATGTGGAVTLQAWDAAGRTFVDAPWTGPLAAVRSMLDAQVQHTADRGATRVERHGGSGRVLPAEMLVSPIVRVSFRDPRPAARMGEPDAKLLGFTILTVDLDVVGRQLLPALVHRHLYDPDGSTEYRIAVIATARMSVCCSSQSPARRPRHWRGMT